MCFMRLDSGEKNYNKKESWAKIQPFNKHQEWDIFQAWKISLSPELSNLLFLRLDVCEPLTAFEFKFN